MLTKLIKLENKSITIDNDFTCKKMKAFTAKIRKPNLHDWNIAVRRVPQSQKKYLPGN